MKIDIEKINTYISSIYLYFLIIHIQNRERERTWNIYTLKMHNKTMIIICNGYKNVSFETEHTIK